MFYVHRNNRTYVCTCMVMGIKSKPSKCPAKRSTTEQPGQQVKGSDDKKIHSEAATLSFNPMALGYFLGHTYHL